MNNGYTLSVKCSIYTSEHLKNLFKKDVRFIELEKSGVMLNPSWFFKFSANYLLENLKIDDMIKEFAYDSHYVNFLDNRLMNQVE